MSSRFGKFVSVLYNDKDCIAGANTSHFLLEKSRVVGVSNQERCYHIFYQICAGATREERGKALIFFF